jgi:transposase
MTIQDFFRQFPDDHACLDHLFRTRYGDEPACPKCGEVGKFRRLRKMPAYTCNCGHHIHPMAGTPFERSRTSLQKWFYAMFLFTTTRKGVAAKELQRQIGVTYKTAWRIANEIRKYMGWIDGDGTLGGPGKAVEVDDPFSAAKTSKATTTRRSCSA